jgi:hypothetical protein
MNSDNETYTPIYQTETKEYTPNPKWNEFTLNYRKLCNNDMKKIIKFDVYDWNYTGYHEYIGSAETTLKKLLTTKSYEVLNSKKSAKSKKYTNSGFIEISVSENYIMYDYVREGLRLSMIVGINFSTSAQKNKRHFSFQSGESKGDKDEMDDYEKSILTVGEIINCYGKEEVFPVYGFGAENSDCFSCNFEDNPEVTTIEGVLETYQLAHTIALPSETTNFSKIVKQAAKIAKESKTNIYHVLLILTDDKIDDIHQTIREIIKASEFSLSIVIVGIGNYSFKVLNTLPKNQELVEKSKREILQFIPFEKYKRNLKKLSQVVLEEIPGQVETFMRLSFLTPAKIKIFNKEENNPSMQDQYVLEDISHNEEVIEKIQYIEKE